MTEGEKDMAKASAAASVGAGVGGAGGATVGVLELAAQGVATGFLAGVVIGAGAAAGAGIAYGIYRLLKKRKAPSEPTGRAGYRESIDSAKKPSSGTVYLTPLAGPEYVMTFGPLVP